MRWSNNFLRNYNISPTGDPTDGEVQDIEAQAWVRSVLRNLKSTYVENTRGSEEEEEQEAGFKDNLKTAGGAVAFLVAFIGSGAYFFRLINHFAVLTSCIQAIWISVIQ